MAELILNAEVRNKTGKENAKKLRVKDLIPTVVYGKDFAPVHCAIRDCRLKNCARSIVIL